VEENLSPVIEQAPPAPETEEKDLPLDVALPEGDEEEVEQEAPVDDDEEVEWNGKKFRAPKGVKESMLQHADYTKKTQATSAREKELDARESRITAAPEEELKVRAQLFNVDSQLEQYGKLTQADWDAYYAQDYVETDKAWRHYQLLKEQKGTLSSELQSKQAERSQKAQSNLESRVEETIKFAEANIKGYTPELTNKIMSFAKSEGLDDKTLKDNWSPTLYKLLHRAMIGEQVLKQQATPKPKAPPPAPLETVRPGNNPAPSRSIKELADKDDLSEYVARRNAERKAAGKRG
jgi:hypothetical protein